MPHQKIDGVYFLFKSKNTLFLKCFNFIKSVFAIYNHRPSPAGALGTRD